MVAFEHDLVAVIDQAHIESNQSRATRALRLDRRHLEPANQRIADEYRLQKSRTLLDERDHGIFDAPRHRSRAKRCHRHDQQPMRQPFSETGLGCIGIIVVEGVIIAGHLGERLELLVPDSAGVAGKGLSDL